MTISGWKSNLGTLCCVGFHRQCGEWNAENIVVINTEDLQQFQTISSNLSSNAAATTLKQCKFESQIIKTLWGEIFVGKFKHLQITTFTDRFLF